MKKIATIYVVAFLAIGLLAGCRAQEDKKALDQVSVRLKWLHQAQFAGLYVADQKDFYAEENIKVTLHPGGVEQGGNALAASGEEDFAIVGAAQVLVARSQGLPVVACAAIYRTDPVVYFAMSGSGIERPQDFIGKRVAVSPANFVLPAMMNKLGLSMDQFELVPLEHDMKTFFDGKVDVWIGYLTDQVIAAREQGYELNLIYPAHYGIHVYSDVIIASENMIADNPDLVERFLRATLRGWRYAIENPDEAAAITLKYDETLDEAHQKAMMEAQMPLIHTGEDQIGWMKDEIWQGMHEILLEQGVLTEPLDVEQVYTTEFLQAIYQAGSMYGGE